MLSDWYQDDSGRVWNTKFGAQGTNENGLFGDSGEDVARGAKAGGSAFTTLTAAIMGNRAQKLAKKQDAIRREVRRHNVESGINDSLLQEGEGDETFRRNLADSQSEMSAAGLADSSAKQDMTQQARHGNALRIWALRKQRAEARYGLEKAEKMDEIQRKIDRIQQQEAIIGASIDSLVSVAGIVSDREVKRDFQAIDPHDILHRVMKMPVTTWRYEWETHGERHIGPMAQDWKAMIGFGSRGDTRIDIVDALGVAITAVQALGEHISTLNRRILELEGKK